MKLLFCLAALLVLTPGSAELPNREALFALPNWSTAPGYEPAGTDGIRGIFYDGCRTAASRPVFSPGTVNRLEPKSRCPPSFLSTAAAEPHSATGPLSGSSAVTRYWPWIPTAAYRPTTEIPAATEASAHPDGGPGLSRVFRDIDLPPQEQWPYHAVGAVIRANTLLRSFPEIDPERIGVTGISWGAVIGELAVSVDSRFRFAAMVYGCGFLAESSSWTKPNSPG